VRGLVRKRKWVESENVSRKKAKWDELRQEEEEEESSSPEEGDGVTDSEGCHIPESEYEAFTDSDGYDTIPESEYEEFTDGEEPDIPESEFEGDNNELGHGGGRGQEGGESGGLMDDDEEEKDEMVYF